MFVKPNPASGVPIYLQLMEQVKHAIETGALRPGEQLPGYRPLAEELVMNVQHGRQGVPGARARGRDRAAPRRGCVRVDARPALRSSPTGFAPAQPVVASAVEKLRAKGSRTKRFGGCSRPSLRGSRKAGGQGGRFDGHRNGRARKAYGGVAALAGLDLRVPRGSIYGLLGRNGAGKTTAIKVLLGMARPTSGTARVFGLRADDGAASVAIRARAAFVSEDRDLYDHMSVAEIARFAASFYPKWRKDLEQEYLRKLGLPAERQVKQLSRGMRTKLAFLLAVRTGAELLILDEPTAGLDPEANEEVLQALVGHVARDGLTVFLSTHQLADVEQIADHVAIVDRGRDARRRRARRSARELPADPVRVRRAGSRTRVSLARRAEHEARGQGARPCSRARAPSGSSPKDARWCPWPST